MTSHPDKYLREKFTHHRKSPPPQAWNRIETGLSKNRTKRILLWTAAAVLFLLATSVSLWQVNNSTITRQVNTSEKTLSEDIISHPSETVSTPHPEKPIASVPSSEIRTDSPNTKAQGFKIKHKTFHPDSEISLDMNSTKSEEIIPLLANHYKSDSLSEHTISIKEPEALPTQHNKKIYYSAAEVNARFLKKNVISSSSTAKPETGIQKMLDIAYDLKYDEFSLGDLRQKKNDLISFPSKKTSGRNN